MSHIWHQQRQESHNTIYSVHKTLHTTVTDTVLSRNSTSSHNRPEHTCTILHTLTG